MGAGSGGVLLLVLGLFLLVSFVTGRLDWLKAIDADTREIYRGAQAASPPFGPTGAAPTTSGGSA